MITIEGTVIDILGYPATPFTCFQLKIILFLPEILIEDIAGVATFIAACTSVALINSGTAAGAAVASIKPVKMPHKAFFQFLLIRFFPLILEMLIIRHKVCIHK